jgi:hypothetical protein
MKSNLAQKATLSFNIINKMSAKKFQDYQNSGYYFSLEEVKKRIEDLTTQLKSSESYYRRHQPEVLTKEQREEILLENEIQDEIDFYEDQIYSFEDEDEEPHYHINDYCDPYLGRASPHIPDFDSNSEHEVEEPPTKIKSLEKKLNGVENVVYQLLGGLFNQETQSSMLDSHLCCLRGSEYPGEIDKDTVIWPTTRQGDKNEEEIRLLKQQVSKLEGTVSVLIQLLTEKINK